MLGMENWLKRMAQPDWIALDVGANIGYTTALLAHLCPRGHVYAFEPAPTCAQSQRQVCADFPNVRHIPMAVADVSGQRRFHEDANLAQSVLAADGSLTVATTHGRRVVSAE